MSYFLSLSLYMYMFQSSAPPPPTPLEGFEGRILSALLQITLNEHIRTVYLANQVPRGIIILT